MDIDCNWIEKEIIQLQMQIAPSLASILLECNMSYVVLTRICSLHFSNILARFDTTCIWSYMCVTVVFMTIFSMLLPNPVNSQNNMIYKTNSSGSNNSNVESIEWCNGFQTIDIIWNKSKIYTNIFRLIQMHGFDKKKISHLRHFLLKNLDKTLALKKQFPENHI